MNDLRGKAVVITGAGRGLGRAYAEDASRRGAAVVVNDVDAAEAEAVAAAIVGSGGRAVADSSSVVTFAGAQALVGSCLDAFGRIDGLVNNAGLFHVSAPWDESPDRVRALVEVNVLGPLWCGLTAIPHFVDQGSGAIVNVVSGAMLGMPGMSTYGASKGAVASLTYGWAADLAGHGVRVNAVSPIADTRMTASVGQTAGVEPGEIAPLVSFLLGDGATFSGRIIRLAFGRLSVVDRPQEVPPDGDRSEWDPSVAGRHVLDLIEHLNAVTDLKEN